MMSDTQIGLLYGLLIASVVFFLVPIVWEALRLIVVTVVHKPRRTSGGLSKSLVKFSAFLILSIWCLRFAVGYYSILSAETDAVTLTWWEEIFNSMAHALQTFSMDEEYTTYILDGKEMLRSIVGSDSTSVLAYGLYASFLNFIAPIAGGAIIFEILASIFPRIKLRLSYCSFWKEKYYFSELNERSLALAKSICGMYRSRFFRPTIIFTDTYVDREEEKDSEMLLEARALGAVCIRDDLSHITKTRLGKRKFVLIDEPKTATEIKNLQTLTNLSDEFNYKYLKGSEIYLFSQDDTYAQIELQVRDRLEKKYGVPKEKLPTIIPIQSYRNLISNLLVKLPLYEPLIGKRKNVEGITDLNVTILGSGAIGTEMFLSAYWFGQMLDCQLTINIVSQESEESFWGRIDYVNPEIRHTTIPKDPILRYNKKGDCSDPYCFVHYIQSDIKSGGFRNVMSGGAGTPNLLDTDYFVVALGSDEDNLSVADKLRQYVGQHHIAVHENRKTIIAYVIYNSDLCETLNRKKQYCSFSPNPDIYMQAFGSLNEVYSVDNAFMTKHALLAKETGEAYRALQRKHDHVAENKSRADAKNDDEYWSNNYNYWANLARVMHIKYKVYSLGWINTSVFDSVCEGETAHEDAVRNACARYRRAALAFGEQMDAMKPSAAFDGKEHLLAWLEHRRWCAFTRIRGYQRTTDYAKYCELTGSHKHMSLKLHPCLVESGKKGSPALIGKDGDKEMDLLDEVTCDVYRTCGRGNFKKYDYPQQDFDGYPLNDKNAKRRFARVETDQRS